MRAWLRCGSVVATAMVAALICASTASAEPGRSAWDASVARSPSAWAKRATVRAMPVAAKGQASSDGADAADGPSKSTKPGKWPSKPPSNGGSGRWPTNPGKWPGSTSGPRPTVQVRPGPQSYVPADQGRYQYAPSGGGTSTSTFKSAPVNNSPAKKAPANSAPSTAVRRNAPPKGLGLTDDDPYGYGSSFGPEDSSMPAEDTSDVDVTSTPGFYPANDSSGNSAADDETAPTSDPPPKPKQDAEPFPPDTSTPPTTDPDPGTPPPGGGGDPGGGPPKPGDSGSGDNGGKKDPDDGKPLGTTADPDDGMPLGNPDTSDDTPAGPPKPGSWPAKPGSNGNDGGGVGGGPGKGGGTWPSKDGSKGDKSPQPNNPGLTIDPYTHRDPSQRPEPHQYPGTRPSANPYDPYRPGLQNGDRSIGSYTDQKDRINPETGQKYKESSFSAGPIIHFGGDTRGNPPPPPKESKGDAAYRKALDESQYGDKAKTGSGGSSSGMSGTGKGAAAGDKRSQPAATEQGQDDGVSDERTPPPVPKQEGDPGSDGSNRDKPAKDSSTKSDQQSSSMKVKVTPADGFTDAITPDVVTDTMEDVDQTLVNGIEKGVRAFYGDREAKPATPPEPKRAPQPKTGADESAGKSPPKRTPEEQAQRRADRERKEAQAIKAAEPGWQAEEGGRFERRNGQRPASPAEAAKWDDKKRKAVDSWMHELRLESSPSEGGIRQ